MMQYAPISITMRSLSTESFRAYRINIETERMTP